MSEYWIFKLWPKESKIRPPRKDKVVDFKHVSLDEIIITTKQNKNYQVTIKNNEKITHIRLYNTKTKKKSFWSYNNCFKCQRYLRPYEHKFIEYDVCLQCLVKLITEAKQKMKFYATIKQKTRKILL